jgi:hypothetical protein
MTQRRRKATSALNYVWWETGVPKETMKRTYKPMVQSVLLNGSEVWNLRQRNVGKLLATEMDVLEELQEDKLGQSEEQRYKKRKRSTKETADLVWPCEQYGGGPTSMESFGMGSNIIMIIIKYICSLPR